MSKKRNITRSELIRNIHSLASLSWGMKDPHPLLHQIAEAEFGVQSISHLSDVELNLLYDKVSRQDINWLAVENLGVTRVPEMTPRQQMLVKSLQKELGWSDDYIDELSIKRYGILCWRYLDPQQARHFINYLIFRKNNRKEAKEVGEGNG